MKFPVIRLFVEHQDNDYVKRLQAENERLTSEVERLRRDVECVSRKAMYELHVNNELLDVLRENGINHRISADLKKDFT